MMINVVEYNAKTPSLDEDEHSHRQQISRQNSRRQRINQDAATDDKIVLSKYGAGSVVSILTPVSICMVIVVAFITGLEVHREASDNFVYAPMKETHQASVIDNLWSAIVNALIIIGVTVVTTVLFILLYIFKFYKVLFTWLMFTTFMVVSLYTFLLIREILPSYNIPLDYVTLILFHWNFGVPAMMCIFWKGPLKLQQAYLIFIAARSALLLIRYLPEWTTWAVLIGLSIWDVIAVMTPRGPLKILVETADKRNESVFPALIYSTVVYSVMPDTDVVVEEIENETESGESSSSSNVESDIGGEQTETNDDTDDASTTESPTTIPTKAGKSSNRLRQRRKKAKRKTEGIKLGLGDFIMYSVLVGKVSSQHDWNTTFACFLAILTGLCFTIFLLTTTRKALPALPISILFGTICYFFSSYIVKCFTESLVGSQIFI